MFEEIRSEVSRGKGEVVEGAVGFDMTEVRRVEGRAERAPGSDASYPRIVHKPRERKLKNRL